MDPSTGRFISTDPYEGDPQSPVSLHRYLYANASPVNFRDPSGQFTLGEALSVVAIVSSVSSIVHGSYQIIEGDVAAGCVEIGLGFMGIGVWKSSIGFLKFIGSPVNRLIRVKYVRFLNEAIPETINGMRAGGASSEAIANTVVVMRNEAKQEARKMMAAEGGLVGKALVKVLELRNFIKYGNTLGPDVAYFVGKGKGFEGMIESAMRSNATIDSFLGVF